MIKATLAFAKPARLSKEVKVMADTDDSPSEKMLVLRSI